MRGSKSPPQILAELLAVLEASGSGIGSALVLTEGSGLQGNTVTLQAPATLAANRVVTLPDAAVDLTPMGTVTVGTPAASKVLTLDANSEMDGIGVIKSVDKIITTAQVLALNATPITVLAAVGATNYVQFLGAYVLVDYVSAAYASGAGEDLYFQNLSAGDAVSQTIDGTLFHATADLLVRVGPASPDASTTQDLVADGGFEVTIAVGEWITGDSPLKIRLFYRLIRKAALEAIA